MTSRRFWHRIRYLSRNNSANKSVFLKMAEGDDRFLNLAYDQVANRIKQEDQSKKRQANKGEVHVVFTRECQDEDKYQTARFFKHLDFKKVIKDGEVKGFTYPIQDFNEVVHNGCKQQVRKKCVSTQTEEPVSQRPKSPSIFDKFKNRNELYGSK